MLATSSNAYFNPRVMGNVPSYDVEYSSIIREALLRVQRRRARAPRGGALRQAAAPEVIAAGARGRRVAAAAGWRRPPRLLERDRRARHRGGREAKAYHLCHLVQSAGGHSTQFTREITLLSGDATLPLVYNTADVHLHTFLQFCNLRNLQCNTKTIRCENQSLALPDTRARGSAPPCWVAGDAPRARV